MNFSLKQFFLMTIISSLYTATVLPTKYRDRKHAKAKRTLAFRGVKKQTSCTNQIPVSSNISGIPKKYLRASYVHWEITNEPALYDIPNEVDLMRRDVSSKK